MTGCRETAARAADALERIEAPYELWNTLATVAGTFGFDHIFAYRKDETGVLKIVHRTAPDGFEAPLEHRDVCALIEHMAPVDRPFFARERPSAERHPLIDFAAVLGFDDVLLLQIRSQGELEGVVVLAGQQSVLPPVVRSSLHLLGHIAFTGAAIATHRKPVGALSMRESECLRLAAQGNTDSAIGRLLSISPRTARFHIENAKKKLGVTTRTQAVAEALRLNAIAA